MGIKTNNMKKTTKNDIFKLLNKEYNNFIEAKDSEQIKSYKRCYIFEHSFDIVKNAYQENQIHFTDDELEDITTEWLDKI